MRILLTGGTGFVGSALVGVLRARGDEVVVVSRRGPIGWDSLEREVPLADAVVHLAGEPVAASRWTPERLERIRTSRIDTTERLAWAIVASHRKPRAWVSASAVGVYGMRKDDRICDEDAPPADDVLARLCVDWEAAAAPAKDAGVRVVHPRIGVVLGRGGALAKMIGPLRSFVSGPVGDGTQWISWIHLRDVVRGLVMLLDAEGLAGPVNLVAPAPVRLRELVLALSKALRVPATPRVPAFVLRLALGDGLAELLLTGQRVAPRRLEAAGFTFDYPAIDEALRNLE